MRSLNSSRFIFIGFIPFSGGNSYSFLLDMSLSFVLFLFSGAIILFSSSSSMMFPLSNSSIISLYSCSFFNVIIITLCTYLYAWLWKRKPLEAWTCLVIMICSFVWEAWVTVIYPFWHLECLSSKCSMWTWVRLFQKENWKWIH